MFAWLTMTPLGVAVEPDVYCKKAMSAPLSAGGIQSSLRLAGTALVSIHFTCSRADAVTRSRTAGDPGPAVKTTEGWVSATTDSTRAFPLPFPFKRGA